jgi:peroxiredoxin
MKKWLVLGLAAVVVVGAWWSFLRPTPSPVVASTDLKGQLVSTNALRGKPYLVNFWATSCITCVKEMPDLIALHEEFAAKGFQTVAVAMSYDRPDFLNQFVQDRKLPFLVIHDLDQAWAKAWGDVAVTPTTFIVDRKGYVTRRYVGEPDFDALRQWLKEELAAAAS